MKVIKDDLNKWRDMPYSWLGRLNVIMILPKLSNGLNRKFKIPARFFCRSKKILKFICKGKEYRIALNNFENQK